MPLATRNAAISWYSSFTELPHCYLSDPGKPCVGELAPLASYVHRSSARPPLRPWRSSHLCVCSVPAGLMVTVLGEAKKKEKLKDHYKLGQVHHLFLGKRGLHFTRLEDLCASITMSSTVKRVQRPEW